MKSGLATIVWMGLALAAANAFAEPAPQYSSDDFVHAILAGPKPCPNGKSQAACEANPKTRRWTLVTPGSVQTPTAPMTAPAVSAHRPAHAQHVAAAQPTLSAANVLVTFASGSANLTPQGRANLKSIAVGLNSDALASVNFEIAGYTDARGNDIDNFFLAGRRADAVRDYLVGLGLSPDRLKTAGYGSAHLADPSDPQSELNRRVELHRLN